MWNKDSQSEVPGTSTSQGVTTTGVRPGVPAARPLACLGASITVKGEISSEEDLQIDGKVEGPISLPGHRLIVGRTANLQSEMTAREVIVYGRADGNLYARERVEIKKDGQMNGDIMTSRISVEEGAYFKGRIEIERSQPASRENVEAANIPVGANAD